MYYLNENETSAHDLPFTCKIQFWSWSQCQMIGPVFKGLAGLCLCMISKYKQGCISQGHV